jgi:L-lactate dehydrogenase (cytochrome)
MRPGSRLDRQASVADLRELARKRLPRSVFDYVDGAAEDEVTARRNVAAFRLVEFRPRVLRDVRDIGIDTTLFGRRLAMPIVLAPTGFTRIVDPQGELAVARAASRAGVPYALSTLATRSIEDVARVSSGSRWFQVYAWRDRGMVRDLVQRADASGYEALILTVDTPVLGRRERDVRSGFVLPPKIGWRTLVDGVLHPGWTWRFLRSEPIRFANVTSSAVGDGAEPVSLAAYVKEQFDPGLTWADVAWLRDLWSGPIVLKGIQHVEDAKRAVDAGVDGVALSNHGGRQLDGAPTPFEILPSVAEAVGDRIAILCDGGIRRGSDVVKSLALGADAVMIGRAYLYGLGAAGERGVAHALALFDADLRRTLALCGVRCIAEVGAETVRWRSTKHGDPPVRSADARRDLPIDE